MKQLGIALIVLGIAALVVGVVGWERQTANIDLGGIKATATEHRTSPAATVIGIVALVGGAAMMVSSKRRT